MDNFHRNSQISNKRKYYSRNRENISKKMREKYQVLNSTEKRIISRRNKRKYKLLNVKQKQILSQANREKYRNMTVDQRHHLKLKNKQKYAMLNAAQKLKLKYKNLMYRMKKQQCIVQTNLRSDVEFNKLVTNFIECLKEGPTLICECCGGLFFNKSIKSISSNYFQEHFDDETILNFLCVPTLASTFELLLVHN